MRIVAGSLRGRQIPSHPCLGSVRLTSARTKEAVFSMLGSDLQRLLFLDLCAGSGQIGLEAYSRGARIVLNEPDRRRYAQIRRLVAQWQLDDIELHSTRAENLMPRLQAVGYRFDVVYLDPPYHARSSGQALAARLLTQLGNTDILQSGAVALVQHQADLDLPPASGMLQRGRQRTYGSTMLTIFHCITPRPAS